MTAILPVLLLYTALGLGLAFAPIRAWGPSLIALTTAASVVATLTLPQSWREPVFLVGWITLAADAAIVYLPNGLGFRPAVGISLNTGFWSGAMVTLAGSRFDVVKALPGILLILPIASIARRHAPIAVRVVSSWLIAVAGLTAAVQFLHVTPGYIPDHLE